MTVLEEWEQSAREYPSLLCRGYRTPGRMIRKIQKEQREEGETVMDPNAIAERMADALESGHAAWDAALAAGRDAPEPEAGTGRGL